MDATIPAFIVWDRNREAWVHHIDQHDGDMDTTGDIREAAIYRTAGWRDFWVSDGWTWPNRFVLFPADCLPH